MAVLQISRIQVRRGRMNTGTGLPQLASGELGWAIDTQQLYIGNGSVSEGAPGVGNTRVLTENDFTDIVDTVFDTLADIELTAIYQYRPTVAELQTNINPALSTNRPLQSRLDDIVSAKAFGAVGDGHTDDTGALQLALDQLYLNADYRNDDSDLSWRVVLNLEPGIYIISGPLLIPPFATIQGSGKDKTIIRQEAEGATISTINDNDGVDKSLLTSTYANQPRWISISDLTLENYGNNPCAILNATRDSKFTNVKFKSSWSLDSSVNTSVGIDFIAKTSLVTCENNIFESCSFEYLYAPITSKYDIRFNNFNNCTFINLEKGIEFGVSSNGNPGQEYGPRNNKVSHSLFKYINGTAFKIDKGTGNLSEANKYILVGNDGGPNDISVYPVVKFVSGNVSDNDYFDRVIDFNNVSLYSTRPYKSEIEGTFISNNKFNQTIAITTQGTNKSLIRLPGNIIGSYAIHYTYTSNIAKIVRNGTFRIILDLMSSPYKLYYSDEFDVTGDANNAENFLLSAQYADLNSDEIYDSIIVNYKNTTGTDSGTFHYWYEIIN